MITRASRGGFCTAIPTIEDPDVFLWAPTEQDAEYLAAREHIDLLHTLADEETKRAQEQARLAADFVRQQVAEFRKIRARA